MRLTFAMTKPAAHEARRNPRRPWAALRRQLDFDDSAWLTGAAPFHFGTNTAGGDDNLTGGTVLSDMRGNYTCLFLRQCFVLEDTNNVRGLWLNAWLDDGLAIWINGQPARNPISVSGLAYTNTATSSREGSTRTLISLSNVVSLLRPGTNVLCLQAFNRSLTDDDFRIDVELAETTPTFALAAATYTVPENAGQLEVRVVGTGALDPGATVDYATTNVTAFAGSDYTAVSGTLAFAPGETNLTIVVPILNDGIAEGTETFQVILSNPTNAVLGTPATATLSVTDNDTAMHFASCSYELADVAGFVLIGVARADDGGLPVSADYFTTDGTAMNGLNHLGTTSTLLFAVGESFKTFAIPVLNDGLAQPSRTFSVGLRNAKAQRRRDAKRRSRGKPNGQSLRRCGCRPAQKSATRHGRGWGRTGSA